MKERKETFFREVLSKTSAGRIRWQPTANESAFCAIIPGGYAVGLASADIGGVKRLALTLVELGQTLLTVVSVSDVSQGEMDELFALVQAQTEQADSKVDTAIEALANL
ncbi:MAG: hypothetical protein ABSG03_08965 [Bryobacteraceae bacterium]|jgi:hypothetical protein